MITDELLKAAENMPLHHPARVLLQRAAMEISTMAEMLATIADEDYRGPRPDSAVKAHTMLVKLGRRTA